MKKILIIDDEIQILKSLSRMFLDTDYEIFTSQSSPEAMELLEKNEIDMVICDMRMPLLDGYQLLSTIKEKYPKVIRIILSGYADEKPMFQVLLHNVAKLYVFKPWNNDSFMQSIQKLFADDHVLHSKELLNKIEELGCRDVIPDNCQKMQSLVEEENLDALITEIEQDPDISELLLEVAKSAVYGVMPNKVKQTAVYIGLHNLKCFLRFACIANADKKNASGELGLLYQHSYLTNRIFLFLYEAFLHKQPPEAAMFAGLMHNFGLILLSKCLPQKEGIELSALTIDDYYKLDLGEYEVLHQEIGSYFLDQWDLPFPMYEVALYHHRPQNPNIINRELVTCVHIAEAYAWKSLGVSAPQTVAPEVFEQIGISVEDFEKRLARYMK
jgi:response regulator RpfG family c-di-GMP phosphodiesterase